MAGPLVVSVSMDNSGGEGTTTEHSKASGKLPVSSSSLDGMTQDSDCCENPVRFVKMRAIRKRMRRALRNFDANSKKEVQEAAQIAEQWKKNCFRDMQALVKRFFAEAELKVQIATNRTWTKRSDLHSLYDRMLDNERERHHQTSVSDVDGHVSSNAADISVVPDGMEDRDTDAEASIGSDASAPEMPELALPCSPRASHALPEFSLPVSPSGSPEHSQSAMLELVRQFPAVAPVVEQNNDELIAMVEALQNKKATSVAKENAASVGGAMQNDDMYTMQRAKAVALQLAAAPTSGGTPNILCKRLPPPGLTTFVNPKRKSKRTGAENIAIIHERARIRDAKQLQRDINKKKRKAKFARLKQEKQERRFERQERIESDILDTATGAKANQTPIKKKLKNSPKLGVYLTPAEMARKKASAKRAAAAAVATAAADAAAAVDPSAAAVASVHATNGDVLDANAARTPDD